MSPWALRRQLLLLLIPLILLIGGAYFVYAHYIYTAPSCSDGKQNGTETGIDCGGTCSLVCSDQSIAPVVVWSKAFQVSGPVYNAVAYVQNPNNTARSSQAPYEFRLFDNAGTLVASRQGTIDILPGKTFAIFEGDITINGKSVKRTDFTFGSFGSPASSLVWVKDTSAEPPVSIIHGPLEQGSTTVNTLVSGTPRLSGSLTNPNLVPIGSTELVALILDSRGNTIDVSKTVVDPLLPRASAPFVFTWPKPIAVGSAVCANSSKVVLLLDRSADMQNVSKSPAEPFLDARTASAQFLTLLASSSPQVGFITFASSTSVGLPGGFGTPARAASVLTGFSLTNNGGAATTTAVIEQGNNIASALEQAEQLFGLNPSTSSVSSTSATTSLSDMKNLVVVLLTGANPTLPRDISQGNNFPTVHAEAVASDLASKGITIYTIGLGTTTDRDMLQTIAGSPNRTFVVPTDTTLPTVLSAAYRSIAGSLCQTSSNVIEILSRSL